MRNIVLLVMVFAVVGASIGGEFTEEQRKYQTRLLRSSAPTMMDFGCLNFRLYIEKIFADNRVEFSEVGSYTPEVNIFYDVISNKIEVIFNLEMIEFIEYGNSDEALAKLEKVQLVIDSVFGYFEKNVGVRKCFSPVGLDGDLHYLNVNHQILDECFVFCTQYYYSNSGDGPTNQSQCYDLFGREAKSVSR